MPHRELNNANAVKRMTDFVAFGEFWRRLSHLGKFNTCQWHSACTKFGHSNNFATLSQVLNRQSTTFNNIRARACKYTAFFPFHQQQNRWP